VRARGGLTGDMREGVRFFLRSPVLRVLSAVIGGLAFCQAMVMSVLVLYGLEVLHLSKAGYGLFLGVASIGNVVGGMVAGRVRQRFSTASILTAGAVLAGVAYIGLGATKTASFACLMMLIEAVAVACGNVASVSLRQRVVPDELLGRVGNVFKMVIWGLIPLGALAGGLVAAHWGLRTTFIVAAAVQCGLAVFTAGALRREVRTAEAADVIDLRDAETEDDTATVAAAVPALTV
jgi:predicted MFS family arabinose efflux permease